VNEATRVSESLGVFISDVLCLSDDIQSIAADNIMAFSSKDCPQLQKKNHFAYKINSFLSTFET